MYQKYVIFLISGEFIRNIWIDWLTDFKGISTHQGLFFV